MRRQVVPLKDRGHDRLAVTVADLFAELSESERVRALRLIGPVCLVDLVDAVREVRGSARHLPVRICSVCTSFDHEGADCPQAAALFGGRHS